MIKMKRSALLSLKTVRTASAVLFGLLLVLRIYQTFMLTDGETGFFTKSNVTVPLKEMLDNGEIASRLGYHSYYLNRVFKRNTGVTIHQAVIKEKIRIAKRLLSETNLPISYVASEVGFEERSQFCTVFRKYTGFTPTEYRRK